MINFIFFFIFISPNVILFPFGINIGSYPNPFFALFFFEIEPSILPIDCLVLKFGP